MAEEIVTRIEIFSFLDIDFFNILLKSDNFKVIVEKNTPPTVSYFNKVKTHSQIIIMETRSSTQYYEVPNIIELLILLFLFLLAT